MIRKLYVFANMGFLDQQPKSGGQTSARRVMKGLQDAGFEIVPIRRHRGELESKLGHVLEIGWFAIYDLLKILARMLFGSRKEGAFLILTYSGPLVPYELIISVFIKLLGYKSLTYLKGGQVLDCYARGGKLHKWMFRKNANLQSKMFFEGMESLRIVENISNTPCVYFPNYTFDELIPEKLVERPKDSVNLLYFGRIAPNKNVHIIVEAFSLLAEKYSNIYLTLIGGKGQSQAYVDKVDALINASPYKNRITRMGNTPFAEIKEIMKTQHFFVFPSKEVCEGHSNSLNEAMSQGLIPVVSDYHFNRTIVGNDKFVVKSFKANDYAARIEQLITDDLRSLSIACWTHIKDRYTYSKVNGNIANEIRNIK